MYSDEAYELLSWGKKPLSTWDEFQNMGIDKLLGAYDSAYKRVTE